MTVLGNVLWLILGGFITGLGYIAGGAALCLTIIGIPFGLQSMRLGLATMAPFGKHVVSTPGAGTIRTVFDVLWLLLFGWPIALAHLVSAVLLAITIIGLPFAWQHVKLIPVALFPFGRSLVAD
jgi:uncharacterized membrane protein YccF (DUF307 family)